MNPRVLGAGAWGTALACHIARRLPVALWARDAGACERMGRERRNARYLPETAFPDALAVVADLERAVAGADLLIVATSVAGLRPTLSAVAAVSALPVPLIWLCKGLEADTGRLAHQIAAEIVPDWQVGVLSGPSFAQEVAAGLPVALVSASLGPAVNERVIEACHHGAMRIYASTDVVGVELAGALKNVVAIAAGLCDGLGLGANARAALIARGLAEMARLGEAMGGRSETFMGLAGVGDLVLTCAGDLSRNRQVGLQLAAGRSLGDIVGSLGHVAEGVRCTPAVLALARRLRVELPIVQTVAAILAGEMTPRQALAELLAREPRRE
ncbi:MAG: NAD(P)H-dependent glycerol-3-phosphate dehydrogenase [Burkholderiaceae bacterium]